MTTPAWSAEDAKKARGGWYDARTGDGWQRQHGAVPATHTQDRDSKSKQEHALMMAQQQQDSREG